ncbi:MAG: cobalamin biosynthesis protein, partial [Actinomycetota bacterium]
IAVAAVRPSRAGEVWRIVRRDAGRHPSPNGGVIEAPFAAALDLRLGGANRYGDAVEDRGTLGDGRAATPTDIERAIRLRRDATIALSVAGTLVATSVRRWRHRA